MLVEEISTTISISISSISLLATATRLSLPAAVLRRLKEDYSRRSADAILQATSLAIVRAPGTQARLKARDEHLCRQVTGGLPQPELLHSQVDGKGSCGGLVYASPAPLQRRHFALEAFSKLRHADSGLAVSMTHQIDDITLRLEDADEDGQSPWGGCGSSASSPRAGCGDDATIPRRPSQPSIVGAAGAETEAREQQRCWGVCRFLFATYSSGQLGIPWLVVSPAVRYG